MLTMIFTKRSRVHLCTSCGPDTKQVLPPPKSLPLVCIFYISRETKFTTVDVFALSNKSPIIGGNQVKPFWSWVKEKAKGSSEVPTPADAMLFSQLWAGHVVVLGDEGIGTSL